MKREIKSIFNATIKDIKYKIKDNKTICYIWYYNPFTQNIQKAVGVALCNPDDKYNETLGKRLAESRAKTHLYLTIVYDANITLREISDKHMKLARLERNHFDKLLTTNNECL